MTAKYNPVVDTLVADLIKIGVQGVMKYLISRFVFFSLPIINPIMGYLVGKILEYAFQYTELGIYFIYVDAHINAEKKDYLDASQKYQSEPTEENKKALMDASRNLIRFNR